MVINNELIRACQETTWVKPLIHQSEERTSGIRLKLGTYRTENRFNGHYTTTNARSKGRSRKLKLTAVVIR
jgi:hypothetical protein